MDSAVLSLTGLRGDGRRPNELRRTGVEIGIFPSNNTDGSCALEQGLTKVTCVVRGPRETVSGPARSAGVRVTTTFAGFSSTAPGRREREISTSLEAALNALVLTKRFPNSSVDVALHVLEADGGIAATCFNAAYVALVDAGVPLADSCAACTVAWLDGTVLMDPNHSEIMNATEVWLSRTSRGKILSLHVAGGGRLSPATLGLVCEETVKGCETLRRLNDEAIRSKVQESFEQFGGGGAQTDYGARAE